MNQNETIHHGIDLGTTNSAVAIVGGPTSSIRVIRNGDGWEYTPSAIWEDKSGTLRVGRLAKSRLESDPRNAWSEFKPSMGISGAGVEKVFGRSGRRMTPVQASTEVLKALRADAERDAGETVDAVVITVPAAFELPACEATKRAAEAAGFKQTVLLQEPTAAALAYLENFQGSHGFWLVFDFGGGTFDAAVVRLNEGGYDFVAHAGDNELGGKLIDWAIVNECFIPALTRQYRLTDFRRGNEKWGLAIAKLKDQAELAKIQTTTHELVEVRIDYLGEDEAGQRMEFEFALSRAEVDRICESYLRRAVEMCREALREAKLRPSDVTSVLLVGGPTLMPCFRRTLADPTLGLGIPLDFSQDPLTVVAQGAAMYARRQRRVVDPGTRPAGVASLELHYKPVGPETDPAVNGKLTVAGVTDYTGFSVTFANTTMRPPWRSGPIGLSPEGAFFVSLEAEKGPHGNAFAIEAFDPQGTRVGITPDRLTYLVGADAPRPQLINSIGVEIVGRRFAPMLAKGVPLRTRKRSRFVTAFELKQGQPSPPVAVIMEGENRRADRNRVILEIHLNPSDLPRDLPAGTEVDVTVEMDESRQLRAKVFIGDLDLELEGELDWSKYRREAESASGLRKEYEIQKARLEAARKQAREMKVEQAQRLLLTLDADRLIPEIETNLASADDHNAATQCSGRLQALAVALDTIEAVLAWPAKAEKARSDLEFWRTVMTEPRYNATAQEKAEFVRLEEAMREMLNDDRAENVDRFGDLHEGVEDLGFSVWIRSPEYWVIRFKNLEQKEADMTNRQQAQAYLQQGRRAIEKEDWDSLQSAVRQLSGLLRTGVDPEDRRVLLFQR